MKRKLPDIWLGNDILIFFGGPWFWSRWEWGTNKQWATTWSFGFVNVTIWRARRAA